MPEYTVFLRSKCDDIFSLDDNTKYWDNFLNGGHCSSFKLERFPFINPKYTIYATFFI